MVLSSVPPLISSHGTSVIVLVAIFLVLSTICLALRFYTNRVIRKQLLLADWLVLAAYILFWGHATVVILVCVIGGFGYHVKELDPRYVENNFKLGLGEQVAYALELGLLKCSLCTLFMSIFSTPGFKMAARIILGLCVAWSIMTAFLGVFICHPVSFFWDPMIPGGGCADVTAAWTTVGAIDVLLDVAILLLPMPMLWKLQMPIWKRLGIASVFAIGLITIAVGIARTVCISKVSFEDFTWDGYYTVVWSTIEPPIAIIVISLMALRPLFSKHASWIITNLRTATDRLFSSGRTTGKSYKHDSFMQLKDQGGTELQFQSYGASAKAHSHV